MVRFEVASAGTEKTGGRPEAIGAMRKYGIDVRSPTSKGLLGFLAQPWDYLITVCDDANEACPVFPDATHRLHWSFSDPSAVVGPNRQAAFADVADAIQDRVHAWLESSK